MNIWIPRILRLIRREKRMLIWTYRNRDWELFHMIKLDLIWWRSALKHERKKENEIHS